MLMRFLFHGIAGLHVHGIRQWSLAEDLKKGMFRQYLSAA
jgi:hypothetical protein